MNKTENYQLNLMLKGQVNKDITYNEAMLSLDTWLNSSITDLTSQTPESMSVGEKYIIIDGEKRGQICFKRQENKKIEFIQPFAGMFFYILRRQAFYSFDGTAWHNATSFEQGAEMAEYDSKDGLLPPEERFSSSGACYKLQGPKNTHYIYLTENSEISLASGSPPVITIILKQNQDQVYSLTWPPSILWPSGACIEISTEANSMNIIMLHKVAETDNYLASVIGANYNW